MIIKVTYDDQRLDVFDTTTFTSAAPFGKTNMLTNFEVRFDTIGEGGLWMAAHSYQAIEDGNENSDETPAAKRKRGWEFLLADSEELDHVELVVVDGEAIMKRVFGELVDLQPSTRPHTNVSEAPQRGCMRELSSSSGISSG